MLFRLWTAAAIALGTAAPAAAAEPAYPERPVRIFVGLAPGGGTDSVACIPAQKFAGGTPEEFGAFLKSELEKWARVVKLSGAKAN